MTVLRVLVAIEPSMYREVLAFYLRRQRPQAEVFLASPEETFLLAEAERTQAQVVFATEEVPPRLKERGIFWVKVHADDRLDATISANGYSSIIHDVTLIDLLAVVDKTIGEVARGA
jgi:hypothetical protein